MSVGQERPLSATLLEAFPLSSTRFGHASTPSSGLAKHDAGRQLQGVKSGNSKNGNRCAGIVDEAHPNFRFGSKAEVL
jgi:hypothetical protein